MLKTLALLLLLANALLLAAWTGVLEPLTRHGLAAPQREPERLQRQLNPEWVTVLPAEAASAAIREAAASAAAARVTHCLQAGPFANGEAEPAERMLREAGLAASAWQAVRVDGGAAYMIYMGRYPDRETLLRKIEQVKRMRLEFEDLRDNAELRQGLSLGRFDNKAAADAALARMALRGLHTGKVVALPKPPPRTLLRVPAADAALRARLAALHLPSGPGFVPCAADTAAAAASAIQPAASAAAGAPVAASAALPASGAAGARPAAAAASR